MFLSGTLCKHIEWLLRFLLTCVCVHAEYTLIKGTFLLGSGVRFSVIGRRLRSSVIGPRRSSFVRCSDFSSLFSVAVFVLLLFVLVFVYVFCHRFSSLFLCKQSWSRFLVVNSSVSVIDLRLHSSGISLRRCYSVISCY
jgi:hypothetical protein